MKRLHLLLELPHFLQSAVLVVVDLDGGHALPGPLQALLDDRSPELVLRWRGLAQYVDLGLSVAHQERAFLHLRVEVFLLLLLHLGVVYAHPGDKLLGAKLLASLKLVQEQVVQLPAGQGVVQIQEELLYLPHSDREVIGDLGVVSNFGLQHLEKEGEVLEVRGGRALGDARARPRALRACPTRSRERLLALPAPRQRMIHEGRPSAAVCRDKVGRVWTLKSWSL